MSRYAIDSSRKSCECAVVVADAWQGKGLGTALMECLKTLATERGLLSMRSVDLAENWEMRDLASALGFHSSPDPTDSHQVIHTISLVCDVVPTTAPIRSDLAIRAAFRLDSCPAPTFGTRKALFPGLFPFPGPRCRDRSATTGRKSPGYVCGAAHCARAGSILLSLIHI